MCVAVMQVYMDEPVQNIALDGGRVEVHTAERSLRPRWAVS